MQLNLPTLLLTGQAKSCKNITLLKLFHYKNLFVLKSITLVKLTDEFIDFLNSSLNVSLYLFYLVTVGPYTVRLQQGNVTGI